MEVAIILSHARVHIGIQQSLGVDTTQGCIFLWVVILFLLLHTRVCSPPCRLQPDRLDGMEVALDA
jgi:hypothetical protein